MTEEIKDNDAIEKANHEEKYEEVLRKLEEIQKQAQAQDEKVIKADQEQDEDAEHRQADQVKVEEVVKAEIERLKQELLELRKKEEQSKVLKEVFGDDVDKALEEHSKTLKLSPETLTSMAMENPEAVKKLISKDAVTSFFGSNVTMTEERGAKELEILADSFRKSRGFMKPQEYKAIVMNWDKGGASVIRKPRLESPFPEDHS